MSYDLAVWKESRPITSREATAKYHRLCAEDLDVAEPDPAIEQFYELLVARYPLLSDLSESEIDQSPWSCDIDLSTGHALMLMSYSRASEVVPFVEALAAQLDLVCFNPQSAIVKYPPSLEAIPHLRLTLESGDVYDDPTPLEITEALESLSLPDNTFAILERTGLEYMQVGLQSSGDRILEYQDGAVAKHYSAGAVTCAKVDEAFRAYSTRDPAWLANFSWVRLDLGTT